MDNTYSEKDIERCTLTSPHEIVFQIKGLIKPDKLPGGRWVYEAFANRWKSDHGSVLCAGLRIPVIPVKVDREQQWADFTIASREERRQPEKTASPGRKEKRTPGRRRRNR